jgi:N-acetylgalactosamine kinase
LSSSSALVTAAILATMALHNGHTMDISKPELAELAARVEHYIGVEGGGMDQAIEVLAEAGEALRIDFNPLKWTPVALPSDALFAVLHSGAEMNKGATSYYNQRVVECRIAAQIISKKAAVDCNWKEVRKLRQIAELLGNLSPKQMLQELPKNLEKPVNEPYKRHEVLELLGANDEELVKYSLNSNTEDMTEFWLTKRATHVYSEASRVLEFEEGCRNGASVEELGRLMNESHESCKDLFECSCPELDETVLKCRQAGCLGARLTGAGWGGCVVALVRKADKENVDKNLKVLFWTGPNAGIEAQQYAG